MGKHLVHIHTELLRQIGDREEPRLADLERVLRPANRVVDLGEHNHAHAVKTRIAIGP